VEREKLRQTLRARSYAANTVGIALLGLVVAIISGIWVAALIAAIVVAGGVVSIANSYRRL
jgi:hypothetical protein